MEQPAGERRPAAEPDDDGVPAVRGGFVRHRLEGHGAGPVP